MLFIFTCWKIQELQQGGATDEAEPFMGSGRFGNGLTQFQVICSQILEKPLEGTHVKVLFLYNICMAARAYLLGYNCADEKELEAALRFC